MDASALVGSGRCSGRLQIPAPSTRPQHNETGTLLSIPTVQAEFPNSTFRLALLELFSNTDNSAHLRKH